MFFIIIKTCCSSYNKSEYFKSTRKDGVFIFKWIWSSFYIKNQFYFGKCKVTHRSYYILYIIIYKLSSICCHKFYIDLNLVFFLLFTTKEYSLKRKTQDNKVEGQCTTMREIPQMLFIIKRSYLTDAIREIEPHQICKRCRRHILFTSTTDNFTQVQPGCGLTVL